MQAGRRIPPRYLPALVSTILVCNLIDGAITLALVQSGLAREANPLMASALSGGPLLFMSVKLALVSVGVYLLWELRERRAAFLALSGLAVVYGALVLYHLRSIHVLATQIG